MTPSMLIPIVRSARASRSEEHTSELQSHLNLVCRLLLEKNTPFFVANQALPFASTATERTSSSGSQRSPCRYSQVTPSNPISPFCVPNHSTHASPAATEH